MPVAFFVFALLFLLGGIGTLGFAKSAIHEILALVSLLVAAVLMVGAVVVDRLDKLVASSKLPPTN